MAPPRFSFFKVEGLFLLSVFSFKVQVNSYSCKKLLLGTEMIGVDVSGGEGEWLLSVIIKTFSSKEHTTILLSLNQALKYRSK